ncbi:MAG: site-specific integrase [bacterium]
MIKLRYKKLADGQFSIYLDIYAKDETGRAKRQYKFLGFYVSKDYSKNNKISEIDKEKIRLAQVIKSKYELEVYSSSHGIKIKKKSGNIDVIKLLEEQLQKKFDQNLDTEIKKLKEFVGNKKILLGELDTAFFYDFTEYMMKTIHQNTAVTYLKRLHAYFNKFVEREIIPKNPMEKFKMPKVLESETVYLTFDEVQKLYQCSSKINPMIKHAFLFACFTGLRLGDIRSLKWTDIKNNQLVLSPEKTTNTTGQILYLDLSKEALRILNIMKTEYPDVNVFPDLTTKSNININLKIWAKEAGIDKRLHFHVSRHTFGTMAITFGVDIYSLKEMMPHKTLNMTMHYAKIVDAKRKAEAMKLPTLSD